MLLVLVLIGLNMRPLLTSVGPLLPQLRQASGMSFSVAALLTALPVVTMGGLALAGSWLHQHVSERRSVAISLLLIAVGALMRELYPQSVLLLSSALLGGVGIGIIQAVMPSVIKRRFQQRTPLVMGLWSAALMGGGGLGAAITPWLVQHSETWYQTLAWWALPAVVALFAWWWQSAREVASSHKTTTTPVRVVFTPRAWTLGVYFGLINGGYASLIAWLPAFYIEIGASAQYSGSLLALMTLGQAAGALLMPAMARHQDRRKLLMLALVLGGLLVLGVTQVFLSARDTYLAQRASAMAQEDARFVMSKIAQEIRMVGMFGCLAIDSIVDAPFAFQTPISWQRDTDAKAWTFISASVGMQGVRPDWTVVSDCKSAARAYPGRHRGQRRARARSGGVEATAPALKCRAVAPSGTRMATTTEKGCPLNAGIPFLFKPMPEHGGKNSFPKPPA